ncbi:K(+)-transporting ATPase subunit C [Flavobacterium coralii]|uniref:K(+)-transporting ATPase subunit C n=1 Tax=Flavobacterium coralii TaxID=2838017 RepID=UPI000C56A83B|nr:potassium-transporting ATPase subunit C [Flavobacterium sp.]|tara:strand:- start:8800 stop:9357 length:558 start_codon:yes stop_codon:yes gene_type:complete
MKTNIIPAIRLTLFCAVFFCGFYTLCILGIAQLAPNNGKGEIITENGKTYHVNVAQAFTEDKYFWPRPSAVDYNGAGSGGSNKGTSNPDYLAEVEVRIDTFLLRNPGVSRKDVPAELVTASGSGLDPHISVASALVQVKRVAQARNLPEDKVSTVIAANTEKPFLGLLGTEKVNVLKLNLALNKL